MPVTIPVEVDDPRLRPYSVAREPDLARRHGLFVAEGRHVVERLIRTRRYEITSVMVTEAAGLALTQALDTMPPDVPVFLVTPADVEAITGFSFHRGCLALARRPDPLPVESLLAAARTMLVLDGISNADNVGAIFRNAWAFGVDGVVLGPTTCDPLYRKAIRTSMAGALVVPFARASTLLDALESLRAAHFQLVALTTDRAAPSLADALAGNDPAERVALILGSEAEGIAPLVLEAVDLRARIPIVPGVDSLNVAVASGIALAALGRVPQAVAR